MAVKTVVKPKKIQSKQKKEISFPFEKDNFVIIGIGIVLIIIGYILMAENSVDGFLPTVISPILLVLGYCVIIPYGILKRAKKPAALESESTPNVSATSASQTSGPKVKTK